MGMTREEAIQVIEHNRPTSGYQMLCEALDLAVDALREQEKRRWIPVTERLPEPFVSVLACIPSEVPLPTVHESYIADHGAYVCILTAERYKPGEVTHWMPLPEPPKEGAEG